MNEHMNLMKVDEEIAKLKKEKRKIQLMLNKDMLIVLSKLSKDSENEFCKIEEELEEKIKGTISLIQNSVPACIQDTKLEEIGREIIYYGENIQFVFSNYLDLLYRYSSQLSIICKSDENGETQKPDCDGDMNDCC